MDSTTAKPLLIFLLTASYFAVIVYAENGNNHPVMAPVHPPVHPPSHPPVGPPSHSPVGPPSHPPSHSPVHPPLRPPVLPPSHSPVHPPLRPPVVPPSHPPVHPPVSPPVHPPSHPPVRPPVSSPSHPPVHPPLHAPVHPPVHPPAPHHPPAYPPDHHHHHHHHNHPPAHPPEHHHIYPRSLVAVEGAVFCQSCKYAGQYNLTGASPIPGAVVKLECRNTAKLTTLTAKTNERGYFYIQTHNVTTYGYDKCRAYLVSSPLATCDQPTNLLDGLTGAELYWYQPFYLLKVPYMLFTAGPFAFLPKCS